MLWKQFERPEQGIREEAPHVALRSQRPRKQPASMGLQAGEHQTQQPKLALTALQPHEPPVRVNVECIRAQALEERAKMRLAEGVIVDRAVERLHPGGVPVVVDQVGVGAAFEELFDEREVAGSRREHQRRRAAIGSMVYPVETAILQY